MRKHMLKCAFSRKKCKMRGANMPNKNISIDQRDADMLQENHLSASRIFRRAMFELRAHQLDIDDACSDALLDEVVKLRNVIAAQNNAYKELADELRRERAASGAE